MRNEFNDSCEQCSNRLKCEVISSRGKQLEQLAGKLGFIVNEGSITCSQGPEPIPGSKQTLCHAQAVAPQFIFTEQFKTTPTANVQPETQVLLSQ